MKPGNGILVVLLNKFFPSELLVVCFWFWGPVLFICLRLAWHAVGPLVSPVPLRLLFAHLLLSCFRLLCVCVCAGVVSPNANFESRCRTPCQVSGRACLCLCVWTVQIHIKLHTSNLQRAGAYYCGNLCQRSCSTREDWSSSCSCFDKMITMVQQCSFASFVSCWQAVGANLVGRKHICRRMLRRSLI